jgi:ribosomal-protein-alanine N-acetyltransferase
MQIMQLVGVTLGENYHPSFYINLHNLWPEGFIIATIKEQLVGFVLATKSEVKIARILMLAVYPFYQRRGIGKSLIQTIINQCIQSGIKLVKLEVRTHNDTAIRFYHHHGFIITETLHRYYSNGDNGYLMVRYL